MIDYKKKYLKYKKKYLQIKKIYGGGGEGQPPTQSPIRPEDIKYAVEADHAREVAHTGHDKLNNTNIKIFTKDPPTDPTIYKPRPVSLEEQRNLATVNAANEQFQILTKIETIIAKEIEKTTSENATLQELSEIFQKIKALPLDINISEIQKNKINKILEKYVEEAKNVTEAKDVTETKNVTEAKNVTEERQKFAQKIINETNKLPRLNLDL